MRYHLRAVTAHKRVAHCLSALCALSLRAVSAVNATARKKSASVVGVGEVGFRVFKEESGPHIPQTPVSGPAALFGV